jgi:glycosyltransferase involved in cell wall biosynthesis
VNVLFALRRIGPYHDARLKASAACGPKLHVLETRPQSTEYPWSFHPSSCYTIRQLTDQPNTEKDPPLAALWSQLTELLERIRPEVVVSVGWADRSYQALLALAHNHGVPAVLISDSRHRDELRRAYKEMIKRQLLKGYSSAIVAGQESRNYLTSLGFPAEAIFQPWDVVDNGFFSQAAAVNGPRLPHFLCVSRLVPKKNHSMLLQAYATYQRNGGSWGLKLVGSGPLESIIRAQIEQLPYPDRVQLLPFSQLEQLGRLYGQASASILASNNDQWGLVVNEAMAAAIPCLVSSSCGCAIDLVEHGVSGWCFSPTAPLSLATLLIKVEQQTPAERMAMQQAAVQQLANFSPDSFAAGFECAVQQAIAQPRFSRRAAFTARLLARR